MSRIGKKPVPIAAGAKVAINGQLVKMEGPKGKLDFNVHSDITVKLDETGKNIVVTRKDDERQSKALHGMTRAILNNMVEGVTKGYRKALEVQGVGYKAEVKGKELVLIVGLANHLSKTIPASLKVETDGTKITVEGPDKQMVGQFTSEVRALRKPEPYKGKGIRYEGEVVKIKPGKAVTAAGAAK